MGLALGMNLTFYIGVAKELKIKFRMFWRLIPMFAEVTGEKLVGDGCNYFPYSMRNEFIKWIFFVTLRDCLVNIINIGKSIFYY